MKNYFTKGEAALWLCSTLSILVSFFLFGSRDYLILAASLIGITSLIFNAKGNPFGQLLMIIFSLLYGIISYSFSYYGEMITYLLMTMPMAAFSLISWLKHPYKNHRNQVEVNRLRKNEYLLMLTLSVVVTALFYFILRYFGTANIIPSTLSVTTSFIAVYLTFRRSPYFAIGYAANDLILIYLWILASAEKKSYLSVALCFAVFFINDIYGFISWERIKKRQKDFL